MNITFLGTASAEAASNRDNTSLLLQKGNRNVMVDVSGNPLGKLKKKQLGANDITDIIFTHFHIDHIYGFPAFLWGAWVDKRTRPLTIHCASVYKEKLEHWLNWMEIKKWNILFDIQIQLFTWEKCETIIVDEEFKIQTFPALHGVPAIGLLIQFIDKQIVYSGDTKPNSYIKSLGHIEILIHEATTVRGISNNHTSVEQLINEYPLDQMNKVFLVHLKEKEPYHDYIKEQSPSLIKKIKVATDEMVISVNRS